MADEKITEQFPAYIDWVPPLSNDSLSNDDRGRLNSVADAVLCIVAMILSIVTAGGNLLVVVSFKMDRNLQTVSNYFLLSLSVADFTIGAISMPLYTAFLVLGYWPLGSVFCDVWLSLDYTISNASVANLLVISFDRYMSVTRPLTYRVRRTRRRAGAMIAGAWLISALLWTPWIVAWPYIEGRRTVPDGDCYIQFLKSNEYLTIATAVAAFYLPVVILCLVYHRIYRETRRHQRNIYELQAAVRRCQITADNSSQTDAVAAAPRTEHDENTPRCSLGAWRRRLGLLRQRPGGCCNRPAPQSAERRVSVRAESVDEDDTTIGLATSTTATTLMSKSQSVPCSETRQTLINCVSDEVIAPADQSANSAAVVEQRSGGECQCSWHGGSRCDDFASALPTSSRRRHPAFILTVEFASDSVDEDITTTADNEQPPQDSHCCLSTEQPETGIHWCSCPYSVTLNIVYVRWGTQSIGCTFKDTSIKNSITSSRRNDTLSTQDSKCKNTKSFRSLHISSMSIGIFTDEVRHCRILLGIRLSNQTLHHAVIAVSVKFRQRQCRSSSRTILPRSRPPSHLSLQALVVLLLPLTRAMIVDHHVTWSRRCRQQ